MTRHIFAGPARLAGLILVALLIIVPTAHAQFVGTQQIFPHDNWWNEDVSKLPVHPLSSMYVAKINASRQFLHPDFGSDTTWGIPYEVIPATQPLVHLTYSVPYADEGDEIDMPIPPAAHVEGGNPESNGGDRHVLVIDTAHHYLYELYDAHKNAIDNGWKCAVSVRFDLNSDSLRYDGYTSADAAGLPIFPGLVRYDEIQSGAINHAVRFTAPTTQQGWITPARHQAGIADTTYPPMGLRMRLKSSFDISSYTGGPKVLLTALKKYGMILADNGSAWFISGATDPRWDDNEWAQLKNVPGSAFEAVYTGPTKHSPDQTPPVPPTEAVLWQVSTEAGVIESFPNPFVTATELRYEVPTSMRVRLIVTDLLGRTAATLVDGPVEPGVHNVRFNAAGLPAGTYITRLEAGDVTRSIRIQMLK